MTVTRAEYRQSMSERDWQAVVLDIATLAKWLPYHTHDSRRSNPGLPDLVLCRGPRLIFAELKAQKGRVSPEQQKWLDALSATAAEVFVWRPSDVDEVVQVLTKRGDGERSWWKPL